MELYEKCAHCLTGKEALHLKDSRGRVSKDSLKGFSNHFKITESPQSRGGHDRHQEEDEDDHLLQADDLIGRLRTLHIPGSLINV
jgi:hypothetical protein